MKLAKPIKEFFSSRFNISLVLFLVIVGAAAFYVTDGESIKPTEPGDTSVYFFYLPTCPHCSDQKPIYYEIKSERSDVKFFEYDASSQEGSVLFYKMSAEAGLDTSRLGVPTIFVGKNALVGFQTKENIISAIDECINSCKGDEYKTDTKQEMDTGFSDFEIPFIGRVDLTKWSLPTLAVILGLVDGFNPCALWVLIFLITLLLGEKSKKKIWLVVGSFVLASAVSYFLFMTAWLNLFLLMGYIRIITILVGVFALGAGISHLKEWYTSKGELTCKVGDEESHKKTMNRIQNIIAQPVTIGVIISVIGLAFVVNAIEFVCSAAIPAIFTQLLALSGISSFQQYMYILLYLFFYMLDHIIIFSMAALALGSGFANKYAKYCKLVGGAVLFVLGLIMLFAPHLLR
ncbi:glutaredoxin family protein [Candidatus Woesearchaeota archaeon]|nr:glutaredoxin family protein [Candidatus Woesearchaeota archaeon]